MFPNFYGLRTINVPIPDHRDLVKTDILRSPSYKRWDRNNHDTDIFCSCVTPTLSVPSTVSGDVPRTSEVGWRRSRVVHQVRRVCWTGLNRDLVGSRLLSFHRFDDRDSQYKSRSVPCDSDSTGFHSGLSGTLFCLFYRPWGQYQTKVL